MYPAGQQTSGAAGQQTLNVSAWERELVDDPDRDFLLDGIRNGFRVVDRDVPIQSVECKNYKSALGENKHLVDAIVNKEILEGRYRIVSEKPTIVSALGAVPKSDGGIRLIQDCSRPEGTSVNDQCDMTEKQRFQTVKDAKSRMSEGCWFAKVDLESAYRSVGSRPSDHPFMGLKWDLGDNGNPQYMVDTRLCFGGRKCPGIFNDMI